MRVVPLIVCALWVNVSVFGQSIVGQLERVYDSAREREELRYRCLAHGTAGVLKIDILLKKTTNLLEVDLDNDVRVKGIASETLDRKTGATYYFLQGGSAPYLQRLTLTVRDGGKWARFTKTFGADEFVCE